MLPTAPRREGLIASNTREVPAASPETTLPAADNTSLAITEAPAAPRRASANRGGGYSLSRQLGLGVARVVIDPGHGGHDPGAKGNSITEADLVLDVALRLEKLLQKQSGVEVVLTRRDNTFVPLEERTAIANRAEADLFISIHANASPNPIARGIETYFLNFAPNPEAEAIAARENAGSSRTMRHLSDIVQAIAMNNKIDESRDLATNVQAMLYRELHKTNKDTRNLGVKQAPFMVLIGATMPSILTEISFVTNGPEASLLKSDKYRQQLAEALLVGITRYQQSLKRAATVATQSTQ
jgi:N-acetylmuramoyl-L-alanine amidase